MEPTRSDMSLNPASKSETERLLGVVVASAEGMAALREHACSQPLRRALEDGAEGARTSARLLEELCDRKGWYPELHETEAMRGAQAEAREMLACTSGGALRDAAIVSIARQLSHLRLLASEAGMAWAAGDEDLIRELRAEMEDARRVDALMGDALRQIAVRDHAPSAVERGRR